MFAVNTYEEIVKNEQILNEKHIVVLLFVRPSLPGAKEIIEEFNYLHYNSRKYCSIYAVGYTNDRNVNSFKDYRKINGVDNADWYYSDGALVEFKNQLEERLKWKYSGEIEILVLRSNPEGGQILNFQHYVAIDVNYGIRMEYIDSFSRLMESLIRSSRSEIEAVDAIKKVKNNHYKVSSVVHDAIDSCKKIPLPIRKIIKDRLFYRSIKSY